MIDRTTGGKGEPLDDRGTRPRYLCRNGLILVSRPEQKPGKIFHPSGWRGQEVVLGKRVGILLNAYGRGRTLLAASESEALLGYAVLQNVTHGFPEPMRPLLFVAGATPEIAALMTLMQGVDGVAGFLARVSRYACIRDTGDRLYPPHPAHAGLADMIDRVGRPPSAVPPSPAANANLPPIVTLTAEFAAALPDQIQDIYRRLLPRKPVDKILPIDPYDIDPNAFNRLARGMFLVPPPPLPPVRTILVWKGDRSCPGQTGC